MLCGKLKNLFPLPTQKAADGIVAQRQGQCLGHGEGLNPENRWRFTYLDISFPIGL